MARDIVTAADAAVAVSFVDSVLPAPCVLAFVNAATAGFPDDPDVEHFDLERTVLTGLGLLGGPGDDGDSGPEV